jgi:leucyl aminopeptidase
MSSANQQVVFLDLVRALGVELASWNGERMARFVSYPDVPAHLEELGHKARLGLLVVDPNLESEDIEKALARTGLDRLIDPSLHLLYRPEGPDAFAQALREVGLEDAPERAVYVGSLPAHRQRASGAGMRSAPHLALASAVLEGQDLHYVRFVASAEEPGHSWAPVIQRVPAVPLLATHEPEPVLYAIAAISGMSDLLRSLSFETLGSPRDVEETSLYLIQVTEQEIAASARLREFLKGLQSELPIVRETPAGRLVAIPGSRLVDEFHPPDVGPGHNRALLLSCISLQEPAPRGSSEGGGRAELDVLGGESPPSSLGAAELAALAQLTDALIEQYLGVCLAEKSRHVKHPGNEQATASLAAALEQICGGNHTFLHTFGQVDGRNLYNIEAEIQGQSQETVIIGAHLDSTAPYPFPGSSPYAYDPAHDPAPGADDDGSGVAGVLAAACVSCSSMRRSRECSAVRPTPPT